MSMRVLMGFIVGLAFGSFVAFMNYLITKTHMIRRKNRSGKGEVIPIMGINLLRMLINISALTVVFLLRGVLPWSFTALALGVSVGLSLVSLVFISHLTRREPD